MATNRADDSERLKLGWALRDCALKARRWPKKCLLEFRIWLKWLSDKRHLPLSREHWDLYAVCHRLFHYELSDFPNLVAPRDFNDRIQWLKLFDQSVELTRCADKIGVRDYIRERVGDKYLTALYKVCDHFDEIDFARLPDSFVIKTNHDSGSAVLVRDKKLIDRSWARERIEGSLRRVYGIESGEWHYVPIRPKVFVEEYIESGEHLPPADFRFHCVHGTVRWMQLTAPSPDGTREVNVNREGSPLGVLLNRRWTLSDRFERPPQWEDMCSLAEALANGWKYVRVDMFLAGDRIYAGEMTFFPYMGTYPGDGQKQLGRLLDFDRTTFKPPIYRQLARTARS